MILYRGGVNLPRKALETLTESMFYVLMAFNHGAKCGIDVVDYIDRITHGRVQIGPATLYTILGRFEKEKYIKEIKVDGRKRTYCITGKGIRAYEDELLRLKLCIDDAEGDLEAEGEDHE